MNGYTLYHENEWGVKKLVEKRDKEVSQQRWLRSWNQDTNDINFFEFTFQMEGKENIIWWFFRWPYGFCGLSMKYKGLDKEGRWRFYQNGWSGTWVNLLM